MGLSEEEAAQLAALQAKAAEPETPAVSDAAVVAQAEAAVEIAQIQADAAVEQTRIVEESSVERAEAYADEAAANAEASIAQADLAERVEGAENAAALALAIAAETAGAVVADESNPPDDDAGTDTSAGDTGGGGDGAPSAEQTAAGDEPPGTKHKQPSPGEGAEKSHWYTRTIGGHH